METIDSEIIKALVKVVEIIALRIIDTKPLDLVTVSTYNGNGIHVKREKKFGSRSTIELIKWLDNESEDFIKLKNQITQGKIFPTWFGTTFSGSAFNLSSLVTHLAKLTVDSEAQKSPQEIVTEFVNVIATEKVQIRITAYLDNIYSFPSQFNLKLANGVVFRSLSDKEITEICTIDLFGSQNLCPSSNRSVFELDLESPLFLDNSYERTTDPWEEPLNKINQAHAALHCFKQGTTPIKLIRTKILTPTIPTGHIDMSKSVAGFSAFNLSEEEIDQLSLFMSQCLSPCRSNIEIAKNRLRDAENRYSSIDGIIDAFVGIEALLNPSNTPELTMRVALNYSTLLPKQLRHKKFKLLKDLYGVRSKIVHGNYEIDQKYKVAGEKHDLDAIAKMSKEILREVIHLFLKDNGLRSDARIDGDFWDKRYFNMSDD